MAILIAILFFRIGLAVGSISTISESNLGGSVRFRDFRNKPSISRLEIESNREKPLRLPRLLQIV